MPLCVWENGRKEKGVNGYPGKKKQCWVSDALLNTFPPAEVQITSTVRADDYPYYILFISLI